MYQFDAARTGHDHTGTGPRDVVQVRWRSAVDERGFASPAVVDGTVYVGSHDATVYAIDATDGTQQWQFETEGVVFSSPAVARGRVYVGSRDTNVYALDAETGGRHWRFETGGSCPRRPWPMGGLRRRWVSGVRDRGSITIAPATMSSPRDVRTDGCRETAHAATS